MDWSILFRMHFYPLSNGRILFWTGQNCRAIRCTVSADVVISSHLKAWRTAPVPVGSYLHGIVMFRLEFTKTYSLADKKLTFLNCTCLRKVSDHLAGSERTNRPGLLQQQWTPSSVRDTFFLPPPSPKCHICQAPVTHFNNTASPLKHEAKWSKCLETNGERLWFGVLICDTGRCYMKNKWRHFLQSLFVSLSNLINFCLSKQTDALHVPTLYLAHSGRQEIWIWRMSADC